MKTNLPITDVEYVLTESDSIVTKTDLYGKITYASDDFIRISGFSKDELIGASHNIVRHPDMPTEVFKDLWRSMQKGYPRSALIKDRCKNGDFFWVWANVAPIYQNETHIGYISVRSKPNREQVEEVEAAYKKIREGRGEHLMIMDGKILKKNWLQKIPRLENISIKARLWIIVAFMSILPPVIGALGLAGMGKDSIALRTVHRHHMLSLQEITRLEKLMLINRLYLATALSSTGHVMATNQLTAVEQNSKAIDDVLAAFNNSSLSSTEKSLIEKLIEDRKRYFSEGLHPAIEALLRQDMELAHELIHEKLERFYSPIADDFQKLLQMQIDDTVTELDASLSRYYNIRNLAAALIASSILLATWLTVSLLGSIIKRLNITTSHFIKIAEGQYNSLIDVSGKDEVSRVMAALKTMQIKLGFDLAEAKRTADENLRIKIALDNVSTGVILADNDRNIIYVNYAISDMFKKAEEAIRSHLPDFTVQNLIGTHLDSFHKVFKHQYLHLNEETGASTVNVDMAGSYMEVIVSPVITDEGKTIGSVAEWLDRTAEVLVEKEIQVILVGATMGDFSKRINMQGKEGFFRELSEAINQLMQTTESAINEAARVFNVLSHGDLNVKITHYYSGTLGELKDDANSMVDDLNKIIGQIKEVAESIHTAVKEIANGNMALANRTEEQAARLEKTAGSMQDLIAIVKQNIDNAQHASNLAISASNTARKGVAEIGRVVNMMEAINESSHKIAEIISVIDSIAFQTNILALNAAVEAARAGKQGLGFAVVAGEVRSLAQRAAAAAGEIKVLIGESVEQAEDGGRLVVEAGKTIEEIATSVHGVTSIISKISAASEAQTSGIEQVNIAIDQMEDVTQLNAALVKDAAQAAQSLEEQTQHLTVTVAHFKMEGQSEETDSQPKMEWEEF